MKTCATCGSRNYSQRKLCPACKTEFPEGDPQKGYEPMTPSELLELLHRCQNGEATCMFAFDEITLEINHAKTTPPK